MVRGNIIERVSSVSIQPPADANVTVIDGGGRTLMPGLIDAHVHAFAIRPTPAQAIGGDAVFLSFASENAEATERIATALRAAGVEVWSDKSELRGGDAWSDVVEHTLLLVPYTVRSCASGQAALHRAMLQSGSLRLTEADPEHDRARRNARGSSAL
jgi:imidazolonepropionase-like amidohydrolase